MIDTTLDLDDICHDCPYFSMEANCLTSNDAIHMIYISCEHSELCNHLRKHISNNANGDIDVCLGCRNDNCNTTCKLNNFKEG